MTNVNELASPRRKSENDFRVNDEDRISILPDDVMGYILAYLPTICAFRTSILSKEWEYKWTYSNRINISDERLQGRPLDEEGAKFIQFMNKITSHATYVRNVCLQIYGRYDMNVVTSWMSALLSSPIEVLDVYTIRNADNFVIPGRLLNSISLISMILMGPVFRVPSMIRFMNLKTLQLQHVSILNEFPDDEILFLIFHALEKFQLSFCYWLGAKFVHIRAPALVTFIYEISESANDDTTITIQSGKLTKFISRGGEPRNLVVHESKVVSVSLIYYFDEDDGPRQGRGLSFVMLLQNFVNSLEFLTLSVTAAEVIMIIMKLIQGASLRRWAKLKRLFLSNTHEYNGHLAPGNTEVLFELLKLMPYLKCLHLDVTAWNDFDYEAVESLPSCFNSLETIEFEFDNDIIIDRNPVAQLRLAEFLLKTASNLKKFHVYVDDDREVGDQILSKISAFSTSSRCVEIVVRSDNNSILHDDTDDDI